MIMWGSRDRWKPATAAPGNAGAATNLRSMAKLTIQQAMQMAVAHHQAGRLDRAETLYRQVLSYAPDYPDALHLLGVLASQNGESDAAIALIQRAIAGDPTVATFHNNLGEALR